MDDEIPILSEEEYRVHTAEHPSHRIVADEFIGSEAGNGLSVRFESPSGLVFVQPKDS